MAVTTLRPNAAVSNTGWTNVGSSTAYGAQNDSLDTTYSVGSVNSASSLIMAVADMSALATGQRIKQIRLRMRAKAPTGAGSITDLRSRYKVTVAGAVRTSSEDRYTSLSASAWSDLVGAWHADAGGGVEFTVAIINTLQLEERFKYTGASGAVWVAESYVDVDVRNRVTALVTAPAGTVTDTTRPIVYPGYTDVDGETATLLEVKIFSAAQYGAGGFSADTSTPTWQSGQVNYTSAVVPTVDLTNATSYRAYVRVAKDFNGQAWWSDWVYSAFSISLTPPANPSGVTAVYSPAAHRVMVTAVASAAPASSSDYTLYVERVGDGDVVCVAVVPLATAGTPGTQTVYDDYAPRGVEVTYRAYVVATIGGNAVGSASVPTSVGLTIPVDKRWIMRAATVDRSGTTVVDVPVVEEPSVTLEESAGVFRPVGRTRAVVVTSGVHGEDGGYTLAVRATPSWASIKALLTAAVPVFVTDPFGGNKYVRFTSRDWTVLGGSNDPRRPVNIGYVEVDDPYASSS